MSEQYDEQDERSELDELDEVAAAADEADAAGDEVLDEPAPTVEDTPTTIV